MEEILGTTKIQIPLRKGVKQRIIILELITEVKDRLRVCGAGLSWIDNQDILQVITGVLVTPTGEALTLRWVEEAAKDVDLPIVSYSSSVEKIRQESRKPWQRLNLNRYFFHCNRWVVIPEWKPTILTPGQLGRRKRGDTTIAIDLTRFLLGITYSLGRFQNLQEEDYRDIQETFHNLSQLSTGSASWNIG